MERLGARPRIYEDAADAIRQYIARQRLQAGDPLPPERTIQQQLGISRASVREALRILQMTGLVEARQGKGLFVSGLDLQPAFRALIANVELLEGITFGHLLDVRRSLELGIAEQAAKNRGEDDLADMAATLRAMRERLDRGERTISEDLGFHELLVRATRNPLMRRLYASIAAFLVEIRYCVPQTEEEMALCFQEHTAIFRAVERRDPAESVRLMYAHLVGLGEVLRDYLDRPIDAAHQEIARREGVVASRTP